MLTFTFIRFNAGAKILAWLDTNRQAIACGLIDLVIVATFADFSRIQKKMIYLDHMNENERASNIVIDNSRRNYCT
jgi:hypothetical protein